jgi:sulfofructosephosphate aldolase
MCGDVPWAVLSAGVDHATFLGQVETAMAHGASGVIAGRSLWKDCISLDRAVTQNLLETIAVPRLQQ